MSGQTWAGLYRTGGERGHWQATDAIWSSDPGRSAFIAIPPIWLRTPPRARNHSVVIGHDRLKRFQLLFGRPHVAAPFSRRNLSACSAFTPSGKQFTGRRWSSLLPVSPMSVICCLKCCEEGVLVQPVVPRVSVASTKKERTQFAKLLGRIDRLKATPEAPNLAPQVP